MRWPIVVSLLVFTSNGALKGTITAELQYTVYMAQITMFVNDVSPFNLIFYYRSLPGVLHHTILHIF